MKTVVTLHGINTVGTWQKHMTSALSRRGMHVYHFDYGKFGISSFLREASQTRQIEEFLNELQSVKAANSGKIAIFAHSFGSFIVGEALRRYSYVQFDRVALAGTILTPAYDWPTIIGRGQVDRVLNIVGSRDGAVPWAHWASERAGNAGLVGFAKSNDRLAQVPLGTKHSGALQHFLYDSWANFLAYPELPPKTLASTVSILDVVRQQAAGHFKIPLDCVRATLFLPDDDVLRMPTGAYVNMLHVPELDIRFERNFGAVGQAFQTKSTVIVLFENNAWHNAIGMLAAPTSQLAKVNPALKWIISIPVMDTKSDFCVGTVNIDGTCPATSELTAVRDDPSSTVARSAVAKLDEIKVTLAALFEILNKVSREGAT